MLSIFMGYYPQVNAQNAQRLPLSELLATPLVVMILLSIIEDFHNFPAEEIASVPCRDTINTVEVIPYCGKYSVLFGILSVL